MDVYQLLSLAGAIMILIAFTANQMKRMSLESVAYQLLNIFGAAALFTTALIERQYGFILMEGCWVMVSAWGLVKVLRTERTA